MKKKLSSANPAEMTGVILLLAAAVIFFFHPLAAAAVALFYIVLCVAASFFPQSSFYLPVISRGRTGRNVVALTFDDGPAEPTTRRILDLLDRYSVKATFFVSGVNALKHPDIVREIIRRGHTVGNHSFHHNPFLMLGSYRYLYNEVSKAQDILKDRGVNTLIFRPPVGIINPKLPSVLDKLGMVCVTFSCRGGDFGNRRIKNLSSRILHSVKADDILLLHDALPRGGGNQAVLLIEIEKILRGLKKQGLNVVPLADLIGRHVSIMM
ncbi:MAG TPA: polysaccharide deacetylase family protein [Smithella sp.]|nr:polysaccharide deacetylase family protein [Smithella sp.]HQI24527.1 polysaccharide deacetylase family protein [Smithella sp.]HQL97947.1 polysaccharide deacetylase family protein [Smithella sp.]